VRVTFLSGDVHMAGFGKFATPSKAAELKRRHYENQLLTPFDGERDHKLMYQVITSAIGNVPPPKWVLECYHRMDCTEHIYDDEMGPTIAKMLRLFKRNTAGTLMPGKKFMGLRNWCSGEYCEEEHCLLFALYVELFLGAGQTTTYDMRVPALDSDAARSYTSSRDDFGPTKTK